jgi:hypothetical protein
MKKKKHSMIPKEHAAMVAKMLQHFSNSQGEMLEAGKLAAQLEAADKHLAAMICKECPLMTRRSFDALVRLGRGECLAPLIGPGASVGDTMLSEMHIVEQRRFVEEGEDFPVEVLNQDGTWSTTLVNPRNFTTDQRNQCTRKGPDGVRIWVYGDDQRAWAVDHRTNLSTRASRPGARKLLAKDGLVWYGKVHFTPAELIAAANEAMNPPPPVDV